MADKPGDGGAAKPEPAAGGYRHKHADSGKRYEQPPRKLPRYTPDDLRCEEDSFGRKFFYTPEGRAVCGRLKKTKNRQIENEACLGVPTGYGPCRVHGAGGGAPMKSGGRYSRVLKKWRRNFDRAIADNDMIDTRPEIAMMDALIEKLVARVEQGDSPGWRDELKATFGELESAVKGRRQRDVGEVLHRLGKLINDGAQLDQVTRDLNRELERRAKRAEKVADLRLRSAAKITTKEFDLVVMTWIKKMEEMLPRRMFSEVMKTMKPMRRELERYGADLSNYPGKGLE